MDYKICPICECELNQEDDLKSCPRCDFDLTKKPAEKKLKEAHAGYTLGRKSTNTMVYLTDQRLLLIPEKLNGLGLSMALTAAIVNKMRKNCKIISIPLNQLQIQEARQGLLGKILLINMPEGEKLKLSIPKRSVWLEAIHEAIAKY